MMYNNVLKNIVDAIHTNDPIYQLNNKEFESILLNFGSLISILRNKRINQSRLSFAIDKRKNKLRSRFEQTTKSPRGVYDAGDVIRI